MLFLPRRYRRICFLIVTPFQVGIILTANLAFLNYLVLALGFLLIDDDFLAPLLRRMRWPAKLQVAASDAPCFPLAESPNPPVEIRRAAWRRGVDIFRRRLSIVVPAVFLIWIFYNTAAEILFMLFGALPLPATPIEALEPFRVSDQYGLFASMTTARYEIEFQGSRDGVNWIAYPFRYKPQDPREAPRLYAPYQPRFDWNLWFASLGGWRDYPFVVNTEIRLLQNSSDVLSLFAGNPFGNNPPKQVRAVEWQYWFTDLAEKRKDGMWWRRKFMGLYAPTLERQPDGKIVMVEGPDVSTGP